MSLLEYRTSEGRTRPVPILLAAIAAAVILGGAAWWGAGGIAGRGSATRGGQSLYTVVPITMDILIKKDGELQAVKNTDIVCAGSG